MKALGAIATIFSWGTASVICVFLFLIGRFFEEKAGRRTYYQAFILPMVFFIAGAIRYVLFGQDFVGDPLGDALFFIGGLALIAVSNYLLHLMVGERE